MIPKADCVSGMESPHLLGPVGVTLGPHYKGLRKSLVKGPLMGGPQGLRIALFPLLGLRNNIKNRLLVRYGRKEAEEKTKATISKLLLL